MRNDAQNEMQERDQPLLVRVQEAVVARATEAFGQDVLQQQVQEIGAGQGTDFRFPAAAVPVAVVDLAFAVCVAGENIGFPEQRATGQFSA